MNLRFNNRRPVLLIVLAVLFCIAIAAMPFVGHKQWRALSEAKTSVIEQGKAAAPTLAIDKLLNPAGAGSIAPHFTRTPDGRVLLSWLEPQGNAEYALRFAIRQGKAWTEARTITTRRNFMKHPAELPVVTKLSENNFVALWTQGKGTGSEGEDVYASGSRDGGQTWSAPVRVHQDDSKEEHGLVSMVPADADHVTIIWLDGRDGKTTQLRQATLKADGSVKDETALDRDVCSCCPTSIVRTGDGLLLAYRDHTPDDIRDIATLRFSNGRWSEPRVLHHDGWKINGCPMNSVQLAIFGRRVAAAWFTAANNQALVKIAFSNNAGESFNVPLQVNQGQALGRASVVWPSIESAIVAWAEKSEQGSRILLRQISPDGQATKPITVATGTKAFPRLERDGDQVMITWADAAGVQTSVVQFAQPEVVSISSPVSSSVAASDPQRYQFRGKVISIDLKPLQVTVEHEAVAGYMEAMTMKFPLKDERLSAVLKPGDLIQATLVVMQTSGQWWLEDVVVNRK